MKAIQKIDATVLILRLLAAFAVVAALYRTQFAGTPHALFATISEGIVIAALLWGIAAIINTLQVIEANTRQKP